jgi:hypothetical protein
MGQFKTSIAGWATCSHPADGFDQEAIGPDEQASTAVPAKAERKDAGK